MHQKLKAKSAERFWVDVTQYQKDGDRYLIQRLHMLMCCKTILLTPTIYVYICHYHHFLNVVQAKYLPHIHHYHN